MGMSMGMSLAHNSGRFSKNLFNPAVGSVTTNGVTCTVAADGTITLNGTATANTGIRLFPALLVENWAAQPKQYQLISGLPYTFSITNGSLLPSGVTLSMDDTTNTLFANTIDHNNLVREAISTGQSIAKTVLYFASGTVFTNYTFKLQLEQNSVATAWEQY